MAAASLVSCSRASARCSSRLPATTSLRRPRPFTLVIASRSASTSSSPRPPPPPYDVLFCGTDSFAATILQSLHRTPSVASSITVAVPAAKDYHATRSSGGGGSSSSSSSTKPRRSIPSSSPAAPTHVIDYATSHSLPSLRISNDTDYPTPSSSSSNPLLITASYGRMIPSSLLDKYASPSLALNVHPSLLPDLRGAAPIQWAIARGYERTGVSVQQLGRNAFDRGDLLAQRAVDLPPQAGYAQLEEVLAKESAELLVETLKSLPERHDARREQDEGKATLAPKVRQEHGRVGWEEMCAEEVVARQRGFGHQISLYTHLPRPGSSAPPTQILLRDVALLPPNAPLRSSAKRLLSDDLLYPPGTAVFVAKHPHYESSRDQILVKTAGEGAGAAAGRLVEVNRIQSAGKAEHKSLREWWKGYGSVKGEMPTLRFVSVSEVGTGAKSTSSTSTTRRQAPPLRQATTSTSTAAFASSSSSRLLGQSQARAYSTRPCPSERRAYSTQRPPSPSFNTSSMTPNTTSSPSTPTTPPRPPRRRGTIYKLTGDGLNWSQLHPVQKVFRTGEKTGQFTVVVLGTALTAAVLWTLLSDMFAPNSPSVIFKDACGRVEREGEIYTHLLPPLRFHLRPTATFTSSPSPTNPIIGALGGGGGSTHRGSHLPPTHIVQEERTGMEVLHMRFYIEARDKERDWTWGERGRQWVRDGVDVVRSRVAEGWGELMKGDEGGAQEGKEGQVVTRAEAESHGQASAAAPSRIGQLLSSLSFLPTSSTSTTSSKSSRREPGTFATGEAHVEMVRRAGSNDTWQYRRLTVDVPRSGTIGATRVWVVKREGEVRR